jgi:protein tyrosine/serine phosphatase
MVSGRHAVLYGAVLATVATVPVHKGAADHHEATPVEAAPTYDLASPKDLPGLANFAQVSPALYRSAQPTREGFKRLKKLGVKTIVSLRTLHSDRDDLEGLGLNYARISFKPWHAEDEDVVKFLKIVTNPEYQPVLVHCKHGSDRTGTMVALYRVYEQGWPKKVALSELPRFGFHKVWANLKRYFRKVDIVSLRKQVARDEQPQVDLVR